MYIEIDVYLSQKGYVRDSQTKSVDFAEPLLVWKCWYVNTKFIESWIYTAEISKLMVREYVLLRSRWWYFKNNFKVIVYIFKVRKS